MLILFRKKIKINRYSYEFLISYFFFLVFLSAIFSHIIFSVGLHHDGATTLVNMIFDNSFDFFERSRLFFHFLYEIPAWVFIKFVPSDSLSFLSRIFSFGLVWIHIFSITGCWIILPQDKKNYIFFPLFAFLLGPLTALDHSISVSLSVFSYVWFVSFVIHYSNLSINNHKILFFLSPLPLLLSHELMSYVSLFFLFLCFLKIRSEIKIINRTIIASFILFFLIIFFVSVYFILFPASIGNRERFLSGLLSFEFLFNKNRVIYPYIASALILVIIPFFQFLHLSLLRILCLSIAGFMSLTVNAILLLSDPNHFLFQLLPYHLYPVTYNRMWVFFILPFTLLLWFLFEKKKIYFKRQKIFLTLCLISSISFLKWRVEMDYKFYQFQKQFVKNIQSYKGIVRNKNEKDFSFLSEKLLNFYSSDLFFSASLIFPRSREVKTIVLNPAHPDCLIACEKGQNWITYYEFNNNNFDSKEKQLLYCKKKCLSYTNLEFDKRIKTINTRFFDFTSLKEDIKKFKFETKKKK